ncbi:MAG: Flp pilus assembly protein CpaB [Methylococcales bacterium]|nr:Flp pilus assembly protein CpaB [Methylococcales bacterium]
MFRQLPITLVLALLLAACAAWVANNWLESQSASHVDKQESNLTPVVVASVLIPFGSKIQENQVKIVSWPKESIPVDSSTNLDGVIGKVVQREFVVGEIILKSQVKDSLGGSNLSALITTDMRAVSVRVDDVMGVAGFVLPGNKVDIIAVQDDGVTETLLKNIKVLAIDQQSTANTEKPAVVRTLTVEVTPKQAELLVKALKKSSLQFTLRNPLDNDGTAEPITVPVDPKPEKVVNKTPTIKHNTQHVNKNNITVLNW